jgi:hypothetical protein
MRVDSSSTIVGPEMDEIQQEFHGHQRFDSATWRGTVSQEVGRKNHFLGLEASIR